MVDSLFVAMRDSLTQGNRIEIRGFGVFQVKDTRPKPAARNPRTGEIIYVPARRKTHFKPGRLLKEALHQTRDEAAKQGSPAADGSSGTHSAQPGAPQAGSPQAGPHQAGPHQASVDDYDDDDDEDEDEDDE